MRITKLIFPKYFALLAVLLLIFGTVSDFYHHHHSTRCDQTQYVNDAQQPDSTSMDGEIKKTVQFCEIVTAATHFVPIMTISEFSAAEVTFTVIDPPHTIPARASPYHPQFQVHS